MILRAVLIVSLSIHIMGFTPSQSIHVSFTLESVDVDQIFTQLCNKLQYEGFNLRKFNEEKLNSKCWDIDKERTQKRLPWSYHVALFHNKSKSLGTVKVYMRYHVRDKRAELMFAEIASQRLSDEAKVLLFKVIDILDDSGIKYKIEK